MVSAVSHSSRFAHLSHETASYGRHANPSAAHSAVSQHSLPADPNPPRPQQGGWGKTLLVAGAVIGAGLFWRQEIGQVANTARKLIQPPKTGFFSIKENREITKTGVAATAALWALLGRRAQNTKKLAHENEAKAFYAQLQQSRLDRKAVEERHPGSAPSPYLDAYRHQMATGALIKPKPEQSIEALVRTFQQKSQGARTEAELQKSQIDLFMGILKLQDEFKRLSSPEKTDLGSRLEHKLQQLLSQDKTAFQKILSGEITI